MNQLRITLNQTQKMLIERWAPVLDVNTDEVPEIHDITVKLDIAIMCETVDKNHKFYAKELIPHTRRSFPTMNSDERGDTINRYKENNNAGFRQECFGNTL